jgi:hypothetical protein
MEVKISSKLLTQLLEGAEQSETEREFAVYGRQSRKRYRPVVLKRVTHEQHEKRYQLWNDNPWNEPGLKPTTADCVYQWLLSNLRSFDADLLPYLGRTFTGDYAERLKAVWCVMRLSLELMKTERFQKFNVYLYLSDESRMIRFCRWRDFEVVMDLCGSADAAPGMHCFQIPLNQPNLSSFTLRACPLLHEVANYPLAWHWRVHDERSKQPLLTYSLCDFVGNFTRHNVPPKPAVLQ